MRVQGGGEGVIVDYRRSEADGLVYQVDLDRPVREWYRAEALDLVLTLAEQTERADVVARAARAARMEDGGKDD